MQRNEKRCSVCMAKIESDDAAVLTMGRFGNPRYLCTECESLVETALKSHDAKEAEDAMARLGELVGTNCPDDEPAVEAMTEIFKKGEERAVMIKNGTYDFALDEEASAGDFDEIPEELLETEEDKKQTEKEEATNRKFNKVMDIITVIVFALAAVALGAYFLITML